MHPSDIFPGEMWLDLIESEPSKEERAKLLAILWGVHPHFHHSDVIRSCIGKDWNRGLQGACEGGHLDLANLMIEKGADDWDEGLYNACYHGHLDVINLMISKGSNHQTGLRGAYYGYQQDIVDLMVSKGAEIDHSWCRCLKCLYFETGDEEFRTRDLAAKTEV